MFPVLLAIATATTATVVAVAPRRAAADPVANLQAEAAQISHQLVQEQLQIGGYQQQYQAAATTLQQDTVAIAQVQQSIAGDRQRVTADRRNLTNQVVSAYIDSGTGTQTGASALFATDEKAVLQTAEYQQIAVGDIDASIANLRTDERQLESQVATLQQRQSHDRALAAEQAALLQRSVTAQDLIQHQQSEVNGQLAVAVAQQQAAAAQAARAAVLAAQASSLGAPGRGAASAPGPGGDATSDPALNPFLQCVVQHESGGNYGAVSPNGLYMGAFQFSQSTWNEAARLAGLPALIGVPPNLASKADQDTLAVALYALDGEQPWYDPCRGAG